MVKYPDVTVQLTKINANAFSIVGHTMKAMRAKGIPQDEIEAYRKAAMSGDYDNLLQTTMAWVNVN